MKTLIQQAGFKVIESFAKKYGEIKFTEGSLCWEVIDEYNKRVTDELYGLIAPQDGSKKADDFVRTLSFMI